jgi:hypothetical protein
VEAPAIEGATTAPAVEGEEGMTGVVAFRREGGEGRSARHDAITR